MKEDNKRILISLVSLVAGIFIISFAVGFFAAEPEVAEEVSEVEVTSIPKSTKTPEPKSEPEKISYYLINEENGEIKLYYVEDGESKQLRSEIISKELLPKEDIDMLAEGIKAETGEEALAVWENFIS